MLFCRPAARPPPHSRCWRGSAASSVKLPLPDTRPVFSHSDVGARTSSHVAKGGGQNVNKKKFGELQRSSPPPSPRSHSVPRTQLPETKVYPHFLSVVISLFVCFLCIYWRQKNLTKGNIFFSSSHVHIYIYMYVRGCIYVYIPYVYIYIFVIRCIHTVHLYSIHFWLDCIFP